MATVRESSRGELLPPAYLSLGLGVVILACKMTAWHWTGSTAVLSDALESVVNVAAAALLIATLYLATRPADRNHPYGHGKVEFFCAGVEGALIGVAALSVLAEALRQLLRGPELRFLESGVALVTAAALLNAGLGLYLVRCGQRSASLALEADGRHLLADAVTSAGVIVGLLAVQLTQLHWLDPVIAVGVALHILHTGWHLVRRAVGGLMDEANPELLGRVVGHLEAQRRPWWISVHSLRMWRSGPFQHADLHLVVPRYYDADRLHEVSGEIEVAVREASGLPGDAIVHFDPCRPRYCPSCRVENCPQRQHAPVWRPPLTLEAAILRGEELEGGERHAERGGAAAMNSC